MGREYTARLFGEDDPRGTPEEIRASRRRCYAERAIEEARRLRALRRGGSVAERQRFLWFEGRTGVEFPAVRQSALAAVYRRSGGV